jgi:2-dehydropantoate 2-reductase
VRVAVIGAGAIGSLLGARLADAGHEILLVGRKDHMQAIRVHGLHISGVPETTVRLQAEERVPDEYVADRVLWTVKTVDLVTSAGQVARASPAPVPTLLPQNGLGVETVAATALLEAGWLDPPASLVRAVNTIPATLLAPGEVRAAGSGELVLPSPTSENGGAARRLVELFTSAGIPVRTTSDLPREVWRKAVVNAAINPVTALHRVPNGRLLEEPYRGQALRLLGEARYAAGLAGFDFPQLEIEANFDRVLRATSENRSSMLQDVERGRPTEIDAI